MDYGTLVDSILTLHRDSVGRAAAAANQALVIRNWLIGAHIVELEQKGEDRAEYGQGLLRRLSVDLTARGIKGSSPDMLERRLRRHLLIDLKTRAFKHADAGQMNNYWKANEMEDGDSPPVGLLLCSDRSATRVQYATIGLDHQLFVSRYLVALPSEDQLREWIEADCAAIELAELEKQIGDEE